MQGHAQVPATSAHETLSNVVYPELMLCNTRVNMRGARLLLYSERYAFSAMLAMNGDVAPCCGAAAPGPCCFSHMHKGWHEASVGEAGGNAKRCTGQACKRDGLRG